MELWVCTAVALYMQELDEQPHSGYKLETIASRVDRLIFPSLIAKIWDKIFLPEHLIGGFRGAGIHPLSRKAILDSKLTPFQATQLPAQDQQPTTEATNLPQQPTTNPTLALFAEICFKIGLNGVHPSSHLPQCLPYTITALWWLILLLSLQPFGSKVSHLHICTLPTVILAWGLCWSSFPSGRALNHSTAQETFVLQPMGIAALVGLQSCPAGVEQSNPRLT